jgi:hypothetical protein
VNRWGWLLFMALGVFFLLAARPIAVRAINSYPRMSPQKKARAVPAQTTANRIGGIVFVILGIVGLLKPTFMK